MRFLEGNTLLPLFFLLSKQHSRQVTDYMPVTAHWMIQDQQGCLYRQKAIMDMASFGQTHTAENINEKLDSVVKCRLPPLGFEPGYVTTDNAQKVVRALRDVCMKTILCMAHCFDLVVKGGLSMDGPALEDTLKTSRVIRHAVTEFFEDSSKHHLTPEQWTLLKTLITVLRPFEKATRLVCINHATLGQVLPLLKFIEMSLERLASREGAPVNCIAQQQACEQYQEIHCVLGCKPLGSEV
ncbi:hypothetical protein HPB47_022845 [Ixodes persulcatus]|uniref:Uncharacterized protein n=1 Tax=Ixodes persulcatus TaxID=34615 RepID=A0AC60Q8I6_IXOPE|nr:hypothetical protein HPB47_022845 [Ixodes persulcatus]